MASPVTVTGTGGARLKRGDVVTGGDVRNVVVYNDNVKVTYETKTPDAERGAHTLYRWHSGQWNQVSSAQYGDWAYFAVAITVTADRCTVVAANDDFAELAFQWDSFSFASYSGGGVPIKDHSGNPVYTSGGVLKRNTSTTLTKTIRVERGGEGYFIGWHSNPMIGPSDALTWRNDVDYGERELGTGGGTVVAFSSAGFSSHHPEWGTDARWADAEAQAGGTIFNRAAWMGIADPSYSIWGNSEVIELQNTGFPNYQTTGPWWVADLPHSSVCPEPMCRYIATVAPIETGVWQYGQGAYGNLVCHYVNEHREARNVPYPYQVFFGAFGYTPEDLTVEPKQSLIDQVSHRAAAIVWPDTDTRTASPSSSSTSTSDSSIVAAMRDRVKDLEPALLPRLRPVGRFELHDEQFPIRIWAEQNPGAALRRVSIRASGRHEPPEVSNHVQEYVSTTIEIVIPYPRDVRYGNQRGLDRDAVISSDLKQIDDAIGTNGYASLDLSTGGDALVVTTSVEREEGISCVFGVITLRASYWREVLT
jgi:hypothetical protein